MNLKLPVLAAAAIAVAAPLASAQTVTIVREVETDRYDPHRTTARAASEVLFMLGDTLVSLDFDMKTIAPGLAESWEVSEDGLTYTFKLKEGVQFCDGREMTAEDVAYSLNRWIDPDIKSPVAWRAGDVKSITAPDAKTVRGGPHFPNSLAALLRLNRFSSMPPVRFLRGRCGPRRVFVR
ncbi:MAG: ABC transporter substrate-binding protein, partial [Pseudomonadota bacterium]